jgi:hypothetical protein
MKYKSSDFDDLVICSKCKKPIAMVKYKFVMIPRPSEDFVCNGIAYCEV